MIGSRFKKALLISALILPLIMIQGPARGDGTNIIIRLTKADEIISEKLPNPTNVFVDEVTGEIYAGRGNRLFIFSPEGLLQFSFLLGKEFSARQIVVDKKGTIYVVDSTKKAVSKFDQFGKNLGTLEIEGREQTAIISIAIDNDDNLYVLDKSSNSSFIIDAEGRVKDIIGEGELEGYFDVDISSDGETLALINNVKGRIRLYDSTGNISAEFGRRGGGPGNFSQPVAVALAPDGKVFALDRNRQSVLVFSPEGKFMGEFGGWGTGRGRFYYPNDLYVDADYYIYVADTINNRLQVLKIELIQGNS